MKRLKTILLFIALTFVMASITKADLSAVGTPPSGEATIEDLLNNIYGSGFTGGQNDASYTNGTITATRVDDAFDGSPGTNLNVVTGVPGAGASDQWWSDGSIEAVAKARFAGYDQAFGYDSGAGPVTLFSVSGDGYAVSGSGSVNLTGDTYQWLRTGVEEGPWSSVESQNTDLMDHMITFQITGLNTGWATWLLCWEDKTIQTDADWDYNDMVIEVRAVPIPGALLLGLIGLSAAGIKLRKFA
jgi:hypothetical protein